MHQLLKVSGKGDELIAEWTEVGSPEARIAEREFKELVEGKGWSAFVLDPEAVAHRRIGRFEPEAETILLIPRMAGG